MWARLWPKEFLVLPPAEQTIKAHFVDKINPTLFVPHQLDVDRADFFATRKALAHWFTANPSSKDDLDTIVVRRIDDTKYVMWYCMPFVMECVFIMCYDETSGLFSTPEGEIPEFEWPKTAAVASALVSSQPVGIDTDAFASESKPKRSKNGKRGSRK